MQRRHFPSVLLYGFGLALTLSLAFNGVLLHEQSLQRSSKENELGGLAFPVGYVAWQQQLVDCQRANQQKDSLIRQLEHAPNAPPGKAITLRRTSPN
ncbi:hypothetical protein [Fibrella forsythiae]|uniref:Uncharacterized protein n=1 Tax=Fibrella forsythiae TaxID=2817061 RepID=A0ABS3JEL2_9BACT|nr:hypothetical protein [Fibrella forsythiae]MBO0948441.1 hypothetical protein [Fibrella forsythiae]